MSIVIHVGLEPGEFVGDLILMVGESFFEVFDDLVDFSAFDEIEVESYGMLGDEFPDEKNEFFLFE